MKAFRHSILILFGLLISLHSARGQGGSLPLPKITTDEKNEFNRLVTGEMPTNKATLPLIEKYTQYMVYRVTQSDSDEKKALANRESAITELSRVVDNAVRSAKSNKAFTEAFAPRLADKIKQILVEFRSISGNENTILYTAQLLPIASRLKHDAVGDFLVSILDDIPVKSGEKGKDKDGKDKDGKTKDGKGKDAKEPVKAEVEFNKHPAVQLYAAKALREFFPVKIIESSDAYDPTDPKLKRDIQRIEVLSRFIEQPWPMDRMDTDAVRFIRKEALITLADVQAPAVVALTGATKKGGFGVAQGSPLPTLTNTLVNGMMTPEPGLMEKHQAAIGLCLLQFDKVPDYQSEAGVFLVGKYLEEYAVAYNKEVNLLISKKIIATVPWKNYAEQMKAALAKQHENLAKENAKASPAAVKAAKQLHDAALPVLNNILAYQRVDEGNLNALRVAVASARPAEKEGVVPLFKAVKGPSIKIEGR